MTDPVLQPAETAVRPVRHPALARFAWFVVAYNFFVILWGAFVRASFSGAGCGSSWPTCNGEVLPSLADRETMIEFIHRATSGPALILVIALAVWAWRALPREHPSRPAAVWASVFVVIEALIGAGIVLLEKVAYDTSLARAGWMAGHLVNTFFLIAALGLTAWWAGGRPAPRRPFGPRGWLVAGIGLLFLVVGASGAVTALGDTVFPVGEGGHAEAVRQALTPGEHVLRRLRVWHPLLAVALWVVLVGSAGGMRRRPAARRATTVLLMLMGLQLILGVVNVYLRAPIWMQLVHLLVADAAWLVFVLASAATLVRGGQRATADPVPAGRLGPATE